MTFFGINCLQQLIIYDFLCVSNLVQFSIYLYLYLFQKKCETLPTSILLYEGSYIYLGICSYYFLQTRSSK